MQVAAVSLTLVNGKNGSARPEGVGTSGKEAEKPTCLTDSSSWNLSALAASDLSSPKHDLLAMTLGVETR